MWEAASIRLSDIEVIETELLLADMQTLENSLPKAQRSAKSGDKDAKLRATVMEKCQLIVNDGKPLRTAEFTEEEAKVISAIGLMTAKPILFVANVAEDDLEGKSPAG
jgi:ribosome-binding ATPase